MNIVFMGTPDFAVPCLERLINDGHNILSVVTREDKPVGRKKVLTPPPVKVTACNNNIPVLQPKVLRDNDEIYLKLKELNPDLIVVVAYGRILTKEILDLPKYGCVNVHGSLLPKYRGASPIQWSIVCGDTITGVTTMLMDEGLDTGDMLLTREIEIAKSDTYETLHDKMSVVGAEALAETISLLEKGNITPKKQPQDGVSYAPIITKQMGQLDFRKSAEELDCLVRGFTPWPLSYFYYEGRRFKVYSATVSEKTAKEPGTLFYEKGRILIACGNSTALEIEEICPDGSKKMNSASFINGRFIEDGAKILFVEE